jgi:signal transduction histidine kinase
MARASGMTTSSPAFRLWHAVVQSAAGAFLADRAGGLVFASRDFGELLGAERTRLPGPLLRAMEQLADCPWEAAETFELAGRRHHVALFPIFAGDGELLGAAGILDLAGREPAAAPPVAPAASLAALDSAIDEAERRIGELEGAAARAGEDSRRKTALIGTISHELRTPLNAIIGFSEVALHQLKGPLPAAYRSYFEDIAAAGRHMSGLVDSLLDAARLEMGELRLERRRVSARQLIAEARAIVAVRAEAEKVDIGRAALVGDWILDIDPLRGRQIFVNLLGNAIKFTPAGGSVWVEAAPLADDSVGIAVRDSGVGIAPAHQARVFDPFYQVAGAATRPGSPGGAGLGLAISRQIAQAMGGDILLSSEPGKGSCFTVRLPLAERARGVASA